MSGDMFNGSFRALVVVLFCIVFAVGWFANAGCGYVCKKYSVRIEVKP